MKTLKSLTRIATFTTLLLLFAVVVTAQDRTTGAYEPGPVVTATQDKPKDAFKAGVSFGNTEYYDLFSTEYTQGLIASAKVKVAGAKGFGLHGEFEYRSANLIAGNSPAPIEGPLPALAGGSPRNDTYSFGLSLGHTFSIFEPYGHVLVGFNTTYNGDRKFSRIYGFGADVNLGHIYIRPIQIDWQRTEGLLSPAIQSYSAGLGVRF